MGPLDGFLFLPPCLCSSDLLKSNSSRLLLALGDGMEFQALLLDEDRAWLMVGAKNHIFLLHLDHPSREPEKVSAGRMVALARLAPSSLGTTPCPSARAWVWMYSELGCSNLTGDTFTPGCLNQWGQPIPGGAEPCWEGLVPEEQGGLARRCDLGGLQAVPRALLSHLVPVAASRAPAVSPLTSSQYILLAGGTARAQQNKNPIMVLQPGVPTGWDPGEPAHLLGGPQHVQALSP